MGQIEVFQRHIADVIVVGNAHRICVGFGMGFAGVRICNRPRAGTGFCAVSGFADDLFGEDILLFKKHIQRPLYLG